MPSPELNQPGSKNKHALYKASAQMMMVMMGVIMMMMMMIMVNVFMCDRRLAQDHIHPCIETTSQSAIDEACDHGAGSEKNRLT